MNTYYTSERNAQILIALLKSYGVRKIIASPGSTNICLVASLQQDPFFEMYSAVDERSAAFMACGLAEESGEPVVLSCTGATASRNYIPGMTAAYNSRLPVLAVTSSKSNSSIGHNVPQVTDRRQPEPYLVKLSVQMPMVHDQEMEWECVMKCNQALQALTGKDCGVVHINLTTEYSKDYSVRELPHVRVISRYTISDAVPPIPRELIRGGHRCICWSTFAVERAADGSGGSLLRML